jgi:uncharacterized protein YbcI
MTEQSGRLATAIVQSYRDRFGRGPTEAKAVIQEDFALVILGSAQTDVERSLVAGGERESVEFLRRRVRQMAADEFCAVAEEIVGRKVTAMLGDHNAGANTTVLLFLLEEPEPPAD